jgi:hypothetical protein
MYAVECEVPPGSALSCELIEQAYYRDAYRVPLRRRELGVVDVFFAIFAHHPLSMKLLLIIRNKLVALIGLNGSTASEVLDIKIRSHYAVGEKIGRWRIFALGENEVVAGGDDKHLDFRVSVLKMTEGDETSVVVSTVCAVHNLAGKIYLFFVVPLHRYGVRKLMTNALEAQRL